MENILDRTQFLVDVLEAIGAIYQNVSNDKLTKVLEYAPNFVMKLYVAHGGHDCTHNTEPDTIRYFKAIDTKKKGKKRIYASVVDDRRPIFMYFITKEHLIKMCRKHPDAEWIIPILANRWVITTEGYQFRTPYQLLLHLIGAERNVTRANNPPVTYNYCWMSAIDINRIVSKYRHCQYLNIAKIELNKFDIIRKCEELFV